MDWLEKSISTQRNYIENMLAEPLGQIADICADNWHDRVSLDLALKQFLKNKTGHIAAVFLYAIHKNGLQYSSNVSDNIADDSIIGRDLSTRPYLDQIEKNLTKLFFSVKSISISQHVSPVLPHCMESKSRIRFRVILLLILA
ncbi:MAG: hypothetical protein QNL62_10080 [Gammaproteobacteria bacterium]|nr:hypothetical protein [Gammaproteobacteria bacterium]